MPQVAQRVSDFCLKDDMNSYYRGTYVTHNGECAYVHGFTGRNEKLNAEIEIISPAGVRLDPKVVPLAELDLHLPELGWVQFENLWFHLSRNPQRRMRKGYGEDMVRWVNPVGQHGHCIVTDNQVLAQIWYGNTERVSNDCVIIGRNIHFHQDIVATIDAEGNIIPEIGKEKIGEFVWKVLSSQPERMQKYGVVSTRF